MYTFRDVELPFGEPLDSVEDAGFDGVEFAYRVTEEEPAEVAATLEEIDLSTAGVHVSIYALTDEFEETVAFSRRSTIFNRLATLETLTDCPECSSSVTLEVGSVRLLSMSLRDTIFAAGEDEGIEATRDCWDCGRHETRQICLESINTAAGDEVAIERATLVDEITDEPAAIERGATLEDVLAEIRQHRPPDSAADDTNDDTTE